MRCETERLLLRPGDKVIMRDPEDPRLVNIAVDVDHPYSSTVGFNCLEVQARGHVRMVDFPGRMRLISGCEFDLDGPVSSFEEIDLEPSCGSVLHFRVPVEDAGKHEAFDEGEDGEVEECRYFPRFIDCTVQGGHVIITVDGADNEGIWLKIEAPSRYEVTRTTAAGTSPAPMG